MNILFLDCEFNSFQGELISMALVPLNGELSEFYAELNIQAEYDPWVKDHVVPHLSGKTESKESFQIRLTMYLNSIGKSTIIADWPDDIKYFCESLITGPGFMVPVFNKLNFQIDRTLEYISEKPHHALYDARGIRDAYRAKVKECPSLMKTAYRFMVKF